MTEKSLNLDNLLEARQLLLAKYDEYVVFLTKATDLPEIDYLQIMLDMEGHVFPALAEELQKMHRRAMRNNKKKAEDTSEIPACDRTEVSVAETA